MDVFDCIKTRRSIRCYTDQPIEQELINKLIEAVVWTPSGKNGQPWKFKVIIERNTINYLSDLSIYGKWMRTAQCFILVFLDKDISYDYIKDVQSCGAAFQNIMLCANSLGLGSCWIGEILPKANKIKNILQIDNDNLEFMGVITLGYKASETLLSKRRSIESFLL